MSEPTKPLKAAQAGSFFSCPTPTTQTDSEAALRSLAQRFYLSYDMVLEARAVFEHYCALDASEMKAAELPESASETKTQMQVAGLASSGEVARASATGDLPTNSLELSQALIASEASRAGVAEGKSIGVAGLRALFADLGIVRSEIELENLVERLASPVKELALEPCEPLSLKKTTPRRKVNRHFVVEDAKSSGTRKGGPEALTSSREQDSRETLDGGVVESTKSSKPATEGGRPALAKPSPPGLSFYHFLFLLQSDWYDGVELQQARQQQQKDAAEVFHEMDVDHDGALSASDVRQALTRLLTEETTFQDDETILRLASLHPVELEAALAEFDIDSDGYITLSDFLSVLAT